MFPNQKMFPNEETLSHDLTVDEASSTLRVTADLFERSAAATADKGKREALRHCAKSYREMAELRDQSDAELDDEPLNAGSMRAALAKVVPWLVLSKAVLRKRASSVTTSMTIRRSASV